MTGITPLQIHAQLAEYLNRYYETAYSLRNPSIQEDIRRLFATPGVLFQEPFLELLPEYRNDGDDIGALCDSMDIPELAELVGLGLMSGIHRPYIHQAEALRQSLRGRDVVVASGTGSGKTEAFLLPVLARLVQESRSWKPSSMTGEENAWWRDSAEWRSQRKGEGRAAAMRAIFLYPMNALVEDQIMRLRSSLDAPEVRSWLDANRGGNRFYFGRYTGRTPVPGPRDPRRSEELKKDMSELERRYAALDQRVRDNGTDDPDPRYFLQRPFGAEMRSRWDMHAAPPDLLITNYSMLNIMLMRTDEEDMFEDTRRWLAESNQNVLTLVIDELHMYRGTQGAEVAYLLRKLLDRLGLRADSPQLSIVATSASFDGSDPEDSQFLSDFFGRDSDRFRVLQGEQTPAEGHTDLLQWRGRLRETEPRLPPLSEVQSALRHAFADPEGDGLRARSLPEVARSVLPGLEKGEAEESLDTLVGLLDNAEDSRVRLRLHLFLRNVTGMWACSDSRCSELPQQLQESDERRVGVIYSHPRYACECGARVLELLYCDTCGEIYLGGFSAPSTRTQADERYLVSTMTNLESLPDKTTQRRYAGSYHIFLPTRGTRPDIDESSIRRTGGKANQPDAKRPIYTFSFKKARLDPINGRVTTARVPSPEVNGYALRISSSIPEALPRIGALPTICPACGEDREMFANRRAFEDPSRSQSPIRTMGTGFAKTNQVLSDALHRLLTTNLVVFSDSRQDAARISAGLEESHHHDLVRQLVIRRVDAIDDPVEPARRWACDGDQDEEARQAFWRVSNEAPHVIQALFQLNGAPDDQDALTTVASYRASLEGPTLVELANGVDREAVYLGVNPGGPAPSLARSSEGRRWTELYDWDGVVPAPRSHDKLSGDLQKLRSDIDKSTLTLVQRAVFAGGGRDLESLGVAHAKVALPQRNSVLAPEAFQQACLSVVRLLGIRRQFPEQREHPPSSLHRAARDYLSAVAEHHGVGFESLKEEVVGTLEVENDAYRLQGKDICVVPAPDAEWCCDTCSRRHLHASAGICAFCHTPLGKSTERTGKAEELDYYGFLARAAGRPFRLHCEELTGQTDKDKAQDRQALFQGVFLSGQEIERVDAIDLLSVTTTMEAGVDIGGLRSVVMANMPPQRFNYQQRVGRAGRRHDHLSIALTLCRGTRTHDDHYFQHPERITGDPPPSPYVDLKHPEITRRSLAAELLRRAFRAIDPPRGWDPTRDVHGSFGRVGDWGNVADAVKEWLRTHEETAVKIAKALLHGQDDAEVRSIELASWAAHELGERIDRVVDATLTHHPLAQTLAQSGLLPMFGFPTRVRYLHQEVPTSNSRTPDNTIDRDIEIAISEWAPGGEVVKDKRLHTVVGLTGYERQGRQWRPVDSPEGEPLRVSMCAQCLSLSLDPSAETACPACGTPADGEHYRVLDACQPLGFRTSYAPKDYDGTFEFVPPANAARLTFDSGSEIDSRTQEAAQVRSGSGRVVVVNAGDGGGFRLGRVPGMDGLIDTDLLADSDRARDLGLPRKDPHDERRIALASSKPTDVLLIGLSDRPRGISLDPRRMAGRAAWVSLASLLRKSAAQELDVDGKEFSAGCYPHRAPDGYVSAEAFLADSLENGAGYSTWLGDHPDRLLQALKRGAADLRTHGGRAGGPSPCDSSCYDCLRDHGNAGYHPLLDWRLAEQMVRMLGGEQLDLSIDRKYAHRLARGFATSFTHWDCSLVGGIPVLRDQKGDLAVLVIHPLEEWTGTDRSPAIEHALASLAQEGFPTFEAFQESRQTWEPEGPVSVAVDTFEMLRRPGWIESRLQAMMTF
ncbi:uncharacterized protein DUF1998 [Haloactinospora alba]|uniref:Uncharacterized protein DUF1998 n=1 Tax=Haloactinospora alba TaxID=405555 RepID=A0A543N9X6_9ACTN|nr:DEAD/DEAH box helicase [Haloactinospora alba]TQN28599.1 uncharacterized protein DUF1998 [Haloactinospora alba]